MIFFVSLYACCEQSHQVLDHLLINDNSTTNYGFVITGHSLGAGCAAILSIMLKSEYSDVKCYSYCPPGP